MWTQRSVSSTDPMLRLLGELLRGDAPAGSEGDAASFVRAIRSSGLVQGAERLSSGDAAGGFTAARSLWIPPSVHAEGFPVFDDEDLFIAEETPLDRAIEAYGSRLADRVHMDGLHWPVEIWV